MKRLAGLVAAICGLASGAHALSPPQREILLSNPKLALSQTYLGPWFWDLSTGLTGTYPLTYNAHSVTQNGITLTWAGQNGGISGCQDVFKKTAAGSLYGLAGDYCSSYNKAFGGVAPTVTTSTWIKRGFLPSATYVMGRNSAGIYAQTADFFNSNSASDSWSSILCFDQGAGAAGTSATASGSWTVQYNGLMSCGYLSAASGATAATKLTATQPASNGINDVMIAGDTYQNRYYNSNANFSLFHNGQPIALGYTVPTSGLTLGPNIGWQGGVGGTGTQVAQNNWLEIADAGTQASLELYWPWHVQPYSDIAGDTQFHFIFDYTGGAPKTVTWQAFNASTGASETTAAPIVGLTCSATPYEVALGDTTGDTASGSCRGTSLTVTAGTLTSPFYVQIARNDIANGGAAYDRSPTVYMGWRMGGCFGQSICAKDWHNSAASNAHPTGLSYAGDTLMDFDASIDPAVSAGNAAQINELAARYRPAILDFSSPAIASGPMSAMTAFLAIPAIASVNSTVAAYGKAGIGGTCAYQRLKFVENGNYQTTADIGPRYTITAYTGSSFTVTDNGSGLAGTLTAFVHGGELWTGTTLNPTSPAGTAVAYIASCPGGVCNSAGTYTVTAGTLTTTPTFIAPSFAYSSYMSGFVRSGGVPPVDPIIDYGGTSDLSDSTDATCSQNDYSSAMVSQYTSMMGDMGANVPVIVVPATAFMDTSDTGFQTMRGLQFNLSVTYNSSSSTPYFVFGPQAGGIQHAQVNPSLDQHFSPTGFTGLNDITALSEADLMQQLGIITGVSGRPYYHGLFIDPSPGVATTNTCTITMDAPNATALVAMNAASTNDSYPTDMSLQFGVITTGGTFTTALGALHSTGVSVGSPSGSGASITYPVTFTFAGGTFTSGVNHCAYSGPTGASTFNRYPVGGQSNTVGSHDYYINQSGLYYDDYYAVGSSTLAAQYTTTTLTGVTISSSTPTSMSFTGGTAPPIGYWCSIPTAGALQNSSLYAETKAVHLAVKSTGASPITIVNPGVIQVSGGTALCGPEDAWTQYYFTAGTTTRTADYVISTGP